MSINVYDSNIGSYVDIAELIDYKVDYGSNI